MCHTKSTMLFRKSCRAAATSECVVPSRNAPSYARNSAALGSSFKRNLCLGSDARRATVLGFVSEERNFLSKKKAIFGEIILFCGNMVRSYMFL